MTKNKFPLIHQPDSMDCGPACLAMISEYYGKRHTLEYLRENCFIGHDGVSLISDFFIKLMKLPMKFFDTKLTGDLLQRIEDHRRIENFLTNQTISIVFSAFTFIIFSIVLFIYNPPIFVVFLAGSMLYGAWILVFLKKRRILDYRMFEQQGINRNVVYQLITGMQEIKLQGCEQRKRWEWEDVQAGLFDVNMQSLNLRQNQEAGGILINELKNILVTVLAATAVISGNLTLGMMLSIQYIIGQLNSPVEQIMGFIYQWQGVSQGQRQRILIARVVYKDPPFIFLDEATNLLDANNERAIVENLEAFYRDKTVVVVAHRLSTVKNADRIVVLDAGKIAETGTHEELTRRKGRYYELVKNQLELGG